MVPPPSASARVRGIRFRPPAQQPGYLRRPRLTTMIDTRLASHPTVLIIAPSGYGKTSAVVEWAAARPGRVAWLTLGTWDIDRAHLNVSVLRALQSLARETGRADFAELLRIHLDEIDEAFAFEIVSAALAQADEPITLVVDDAHRAQDALSEGLLGAFIRGECEQLQTIVAGTGYVEIALSRIAVTQSACIIRPRDLAFARDEVVAFCATDNTHVDVDTILAETNGWPVALRFVQLSGGGASGVVDGTDEPLLRRYIRDHVLSALPDDVVAFVLDTSVCGILTPGLATEISGGADGGALLEKCTDLGLFLDRFDTQFGVAYRWHGAAARHFRALLDQAKPGRRAEVLRIAAAHLQDEEPLTAAQYLVDAGETEEGIQVVARHWVGLAVG
ncbi:MAG TPA: hypothetical protein VN035_11895, partial [Microbacterium sp.]|nr:hypothetical protein [Microbacterium sp.]